LEGGTRVQVIRRPAAFSWALQSRFISHKITRSNWSELEGEAEI